MYSARVQPALPGNRINVDYLKKTETNIKFGALHIFYAC